jgi:predicted HTH transcriptional regulator
MDSKLGVDQMSGHEYLTAYVRPTTTANDEARMPISTEVFRDIRNVPKKDFNERQVWFLIRLKSTRGTRAEDIAAHFEVAIKTARRDIEGLKMARKIKFVGTKRTGKYEVIDK